MKRQRRDIVIGNGNILDAKGLSHLMPQAPRFASDHRGTIVSVSYALCFSLELTRLPLAWQLKRYKAVCLIPGVVPVAILLDTGRTTLKQRWRNFRRNLKRDGYTYAWPRLIASLRAITDGLVDRSCVDSTAVTTLLKTAFPERSFSLDDLSLRFGIPVIKAGNLNEKIAIQHLSDCRANIGIVLGTRVLKPALFEVPKLGCLNVHKGKVPEYRGMPPAFWELYEGAESARRSQCIPWRAVWTRVTSWQQGTYPYIPVKHPTAFARRCIEPQQTRS